MTKVAKVKGIRRLVDQGYVINKQISKLNDELSKIKEKIRQHAKAVHSPEVKGNRFKTTVADYVQTTIDSKKAWKELGSSIEAFVKVCKVNLGPLKKQLDSTQISRVSIVNVKRYHTVRFYAINEEIPEEETKRLPRRMDGSE